MQALLEESSTIRDPLCGDELDAKIKVEPNSSTWMQLGDNFRGLTLRVTLITEKTLPLFQGRSELGISSYKPTKILSMGFTDFLSDGGLKSENLVQCDTPTDG